MADRRAVGNATRRPLPGRRWLLQHGPIDIVLSIDGTAKSVAYGEEIVWTRFQSVLTELCDELAALRQPMDRAPHLRGVVAKKMAHACVPFAGQFITPMAAVAGAVADHLVEPLRTLDGVHKAYANNGGDIAIHLTPGECYRVGVVANVSAADESARLNGDFELRYETPVRGVATSGWRGSSFSLGIADSVTVLAASAAAADAAATMIGNSVNVDHPGIQRQLAETLKDDTDLRGHWVTIAVPQLAPNVVAAALDAGATQASVLRSKGDRKSVV